MFEFIHSGLAEWLCLVTVFVTCIVFCWRYWTFIHAYSKFPSLRLDVLLVLKCLPGRYPKTVPFTSVVFQELVKQCKRFEKGFCLLWFIRPHLIVYNEEFCKRFFNEHAITDKGTIYRLAEGVCGRGLLTSNEDVWKIHRKYLNPVFHSDVLKGKIRIFNSNAAEWTRKLEDVVGKPTTALLDFSKYYSFNILTESILGVKLSDEKFGSKILDYLEAVEQVSQNLIYRGSQPWLHWKITMPLFSAGKKFLKLCDDLNGFTQEILLEMKKSYVASNGVFNEDLTCNVENKKSFARILLEQHLKNPTFTIKDVQDEISSMMIAGHDTVSYGLMWCFYMLGKHPDVQEKVFKEIETIRGQDITYDELCELKYLECVIKETLRLYSPMPIYSRKLQKEIQCGEYVVPKGTEICFFVFLMHRNPDIYSEPEKFDPDRFSENSDIRPWMHMPFSEGYRNCIGKKFAMMEFKVILLHILRRFEIRTLDKIEDTDLDWTIVLKTVNPVRMLFSLRQTVP